MLKRTDRLLEPEGMGESKEILRPRYRGPHRDCDCMNEQNFERFKTD